MSDVCEEDGCLIGSESGSDFCPKHKEKAFEEAGMVKKTEEVEKGVYKMVSYHEYREVNKVKAETEEEAKKALEEKKDLKGEFDHTVHEEVKKVDTVVEEEETGDEKVVERQDYWKKLGAMS